MQPLQQDFGDNSFSELKQNEKNMYTSAESKKYIYTSALDDED